MDINLADAKLVKKIKDETSQYLYEEEGLDRFINVMDNYQLNIDLNQIESLPYLYKLKDSFELTHTLYKVRDDYDLKTHSIICTIVAEIARQQLMDDVAVSFVFRAFAEQSKITRYDPADVVNNPYLRNMSLVGKKQGWCSCKNHTIYRGNIFIDEFPYVVRSGKWSIGIGYISDDVDTVGLDYPASNWPEVLSPSKIKLTQPYIDNAKGNVIVLGVKLGYFPYMAHLKDNVNKVTVVYDRNNELEFFKNEIVPQFDYPQKIETVLADPLEYMKELNDGDYDYCFVERYVLWSDIQEYVHLINATHHLKNLQVDVYMEENILRKLKSKEVLSMYMKANVSSMPIPTYPDDRYIIKSWEEFENWIEKDDRIKEMLLHRCG